MILPPFFGISSKYDVDFVKQLILTYLQCDSIVYKKPSAFVNVTFLQIDGVTYQVFSPFVDVTYLQNDVLSLPKLGQNLYVTFANIDVLSYDPPPSLPERPTFIFWLEEDSQIDLSWDTPYNNRCDIVEYILQYADTLQKSSFLDENYDQILDEIGNPLKRESTIDSYVWYTFDKKYLLSENRLKLISSIDELFISENSNGVGLVNTSTVTGLINNNPYIFRVAARNCVGSGEFGYSDILFPQPILHVYCDILLYLRPNSTTDIIASLSDFSCYEKTSFAVGQPSVSSESQFGAGSLYFDGVLDESLIPATYPHIQTTKDNYYSWSLEKDFTIELWVKPLSSSPNSNQTIISSYSQKPNAINDHFWKLYYNNNGIKFKIGISDNDFVELSTQNYVLSNSSFAHIAVCRFNNYIRLYVDGIRHDRQYYDTDIIIDNDYLILAGDQTYDYVTSDTNNINRGAIVEPYIGYIDNVMISKSARYAKNFTPQEYLELKNCDVCTPLDAPSNLQVIYVP